MANPLAAAWSYLRGDDLKVRLPATGETKAATLTVPASRQPYGYWLGDPVSSGQFVEYGATWGLWRGNGAFDYRRAVGDGTQSSIVQACFGAIADAFPEPPPTYYRMGRDGEEEKVPGHEAVRLLKRPNPFMSWEGAGRYIARTQHGAGAAYFWKGRSAGNRVVELWPIPPSQIRPAWPNDDASTRTWITHFAYQPDTRYEPQHLPVEDVVYLPYCLDPHDLRTPVSPLLTVLREVFTDEECSAFLASLVGNYAVPPIAVTPDPAVGGGASKEDAEKIKNTMVQKFGGDHRGEPMVTMAPWNFTKVGYSPAELDLDKLRQIPESRIAAVLGVPAIVAHLLVGMDRATYNNTEGLREHFTESKMIPYWRLVAADLSHALIPEFGGDETRERIGFDLTDVRALQEDEDAKYKRLSEALGKGGITLNDFRRELGFPEYGDEGEVLYVPINVNPTRPEDLIPEEEPMPALPTNGVPPLPTPRATVQEVPPGQAETRAKVRLLPPVRAVKKANPMAQSITRLRSRLQTPLEADLRRFFTAQADRIAGRLVNASQGAKATSPVLPSAEELVPDDFEMKRLSDVLEPYYLRSLQGMHGLTEDAIGLAFELDDPTTRRYLAEAGANIQGITDTTREAVRHALQEGQAAGEGIPELAKRLRGLPAFDKARATTIARTELGESTNKAAQYSYEASGVVVGIEIFDQESDEVCKGWNGRKFTLQEARDVPYLLHPNCTMARSPIVDAAELVSAA